MGIGSARAPSRPARPWARGQEVGGEGAGGAGGRGDAGAGQVGEDGLYDEGGLDGGNDAQPGATAGTGEDVEAERAAQQRRPGPGARGAGGAGAGLVLEGGAVRGGAVVTDDLRAPAGPRGEEAVIHKQGLTAGRGMRAASFSEEVRRSVGGRPVDRRSRGADKRATFAAVPNRPRP